MGLCGSTHSKADEEVKFTSIGGVDGSEAKPSAAAATTSEPATATATTAPVGASATTTEAAATSSSSAASPAAAPASEPKKLDPKDFMLSRLSNTVIVREPGSIGGQAFSIEECVGCDIYLLDNSAQVTVDECEDCRVSGNERGDEAVLVLVLLLLSLLLLWLLSLQQCLFACVYAMRAIAVLYVCITNNAALLFSSLTLCHTVLHRSL